MSKEKGQPATGCPSENAAARKPLATENSARRGVVVPLPLRWARALIEGVGGPIPPYGSADWASLPDDSRAKVASCVQAAEAWRTRRHQGAAESAYPSSSRRAREITEARRPRPGDFMGGTVSWDRDEAAADA